MGMAFLALDIPLSGRRIPLILALYSPTPAGVYHTRYPVMFYGAFKPEGDSAFFSERVSAGFPGWVVGIVG
jgi:hypothetical protein